MTVHLTTTATRPDVASTREHPLLASGDPAPGEPASGDPAPGEPAPGEPAPGDRAAAEPASGDPAAAELADGMPAAPDTAGLADDGAGGTDAAWHLVYAAQSGDTAAFAELYDRYVDMVFRYVMFRLGDRELAEDVTSETFLRALRRIGSVSYQGRDVGAWFVTIGRNLVLDHVKSSRVKREVVTSEVADSGPAAFTGTSRDGGPEQQVLALAAKEELLRCVQALGDDQRECIVLRFIQGLSLAETAEIMHRGEGAVKALQHRAIRRLANLMPPALA